MNKLKDIKFLDLKKINLSKKAEMVSAFEAFLNSGWYVLGKQVEEFEKEYSDFSKTKYSIGVANGLDALIISLKCLEIGHGDEVIVPSNTYIATWLAVSACGAKPVPVEPKIDTYNINPSLITSKINKNTKAVLAVNLYGQSAELKEIKNICDDNNIFLIEDNAQAQGAKCNGELTGSFGIINGTSFYPGKNLGALGDAGAITTDNNDLFLKAKILRNYGSEKKYYNIIQGHNSRLDELQASFLRVKLKSLNDQNLKRQEIASIYKKQLIGVGDIILPKEAKDCTSVFHLFVIRTKSRNELLNYLKNNNIETMIHYPIPPSLQNAYKELNFKKGDFPIAELIADSSLSLPIGPHLNFGEVEYVCEIIKIFFNK
ncbi:DegT/DnrJ/EryC1/StrS family aminotransferase [Flavobacteriaceae bacterium]|nr:DegT/DnrJ/EryC1/StrS family aminotransferase [Flavobacteriaceae bacterium]